MWRLVDECGEISVYSLFEVTVCVFWLMTAYAALLNLQSITICNLIKRKRAHNGNVSRKTDLGQRRTDAPADETIDQSALIISSPDVADGPFSLSGRHGDEMNDNSWLQIVHPLPEKESDDKKLITSAFLLTEALIVTGRFTRLNWISKIWVMPTLLHTHSSDLTVNYVCFLTV